LFHFFLLGDKCGAVMLGPSYKTQLLSFSWNHTTTTTTILTIKHNFVKHIKLVKLKEIETQNSTYHGLHIQNHPD
jgi:3-oxoacyl-[acyl-carrier-protein] synthase III